MIRYDDQNRTLSLGVRELVEAIPPEGDLRLGSTSAGRLFARPSRRAALGREVHEIWAEIQLSQEEAYRREVQIAASYVLCGWSCAIAGRLDGVVDRGGVTVVDEVKSVLLRRAELMDLDPGDLAPGLRQLQVYLALLERQERGEVRGNLVLISLIDGSHRAIETRAEPTTHALVERTLKELVLWRESHIEHRRIRRASDVHFAHDQTRPGQDAILKKTDEILQHGGHLLLQAPPGLGKTAAALKAAIEVTFARDARLFMATARNTQQDMAEQTLLSMARRGVPIHSVTLRARARVCPNRELSCSPESCSYAVSYHDRVREGDLVAKLLRQGVNTVTSLGGFARKHHLCPHQLAMELAHRVDVVVGDYNYLFDPDVASSRLLDQDGDPWFAVVDEAHNLPDRARAWGTAELSASQAESVAAILRDGHPSLEPFARFCDSLSTLVRTADTSSGDCAGPRPLGDGSSRLDSLDSAPFARLLDQAEALAPEYLRLALAHELHPLRTPGAHGDSDAWQQLCWDLARFHDRLEEIGPETVILHRQESSLSGPSRALPRRSTESAWGLKLLCRDPSPLLAPRFASLSGSVLMSATLEPLAFYRELLGLEAERTDHLEIDPFFDPERLAVIVAPTVSTLFRERARYLEPTRELLRRVAQAIPGNCALLFSGFAHRDEVCQGLELPERELLFQQPGMGERERDSILDALRRGKGARPLVLVGVLGGIFAEGVDLPGDALLGVVIVGPALPAVTVEQELIAEWYQHRWSEGFRLAYLVPGMTRVIQAAGRVLRSATDHGVVVLVDRRFLQNDYVAFFPASWQPRRSSRPWEAVETFFGASTPLGEIKPALLHTKNPRTSSPAPQSKEIP